jgi:uncharacterized membrane protein YraQ (UPF0718 family)
VRRHLGGRGVGAPLKAALLGIPLPICSCGVIPLAAGLRERGASKAATLSFLVATPQTSVDSVLLCLVLIGPVFAVASPLAALVAAVVAALLFALIGGAGSAAPPPATADAPPVEHRGLVATTRRALVYGFGKMPGDIGREVLVGLLVAALIALYFSAESYAAYLGNGLLGKLAMVLAAVPVYVCSTASVPVVAALIAKGVSPGTAFVFFLAGPATNAATIATVGKVLGGRAVAAYLGAVIAVALGAGVLIDVLMVEGLSGLAVGGHDHAAMGWGYHLSGAILLAVLLRPSLLALARRLRQAPATTGSCCGQEAGAACCDQREAQPSSCCGGHETAPRSETAGCCGGGPKPTEEVSCCHGPAKTAPSAGSSCCGH